ncbi:MAG: efflux transporter outer membrane subunit [Cryomorphaceae bacterium]|nr:MAG: efflux transporter outer membrane subunit [Cryomorphaceae bacterium]
MSTKNLGILICILLLAGCKAGKNYQGTKLNIPDSFYFEKEENPPGYLEVNTDSLNKEHIKDIEWFGLFSDPILDSLIKQALAYNQDLNVAAEAIVQAQDGLVIQRSAMLPYIGKEFGASRGNFQGTVLPDVDNLFYTAAFVNWDLDFWGKYRRLNEAARARIVQTAEGYRATRLSLISTVASEYFLLLDFRARLEISERNLALRDSMLNIVEQRFEKGIVAEIEVNQAQIKRAVAAEAVPVWKRLIAQTENRISVLTGTNPRRMPITPRLLEQDTSITIPAGLPSELLLRRPDIVAAEQSLIAQNALIGVAKANRLPGISLTGLFGLATNELSNISDIPFAWNVGGALTGPIFNFGRFRRQVFIEQSKAVQAELVYQRVVLNAFRSVEDALVEISTLKEELLAREARLKASINAQRLSAERYDKGVTSYLEFLESQRQAFESELNYTSARRELLVAYVKLYQALGGGW